MKIKNIHIANYQYNLLRLGSVALKTYLLVALFLHTHTFIQFVSILIQSLNLSSFNMLLNRFIIVLKAKR